jgi:hypothetical protein
MGVSFYSVLEYSFYGLYQSFGRLDISRDNELFAAIAFGEGGITDNLPYPPRGLPPDLSLVSSELFFTEPDNVRDYLENSGLEDDGQPGIEEYVRGYGGWAIREYQTIGHVPTPEMYDHSWLNLNELKEALATRNLSLNMMSVDFRAVIAAMETLAEEYSPEKVRLVFCFGLWLRVPRHLTTHSTGAELACLSSRTWMTFDNSSRPVNSGVSWLLFMTKWNTIKHSVVLLLLILVSGCAAKQSSQPQSVAAQTQEVARPTAEPTPAQFPQMTPAEARNLDRLLPKNVRRILEQSAELELVSIKPCLEGAFPDLKRVAPDKFQGCPIEKRVVATDAALKRQLLDALYYGVGTSTSSAACFSPRHGIRGSHNGERVELVICFHCSNFRGVATSGQLSGLISDAPREFFERLLADGGKS